MKFAIAFLCLLAWAAPLSVAAPQSSPAAQTAATVSEGTNAPDFTLSSQDGKSISLNQYRGKWIVLYFYPKDFTQGCTIEAHNFQRDAAQYVAKNAVILGVSLDSPDSHKQFCAKEGLNFKLLADEQGKVASQYGSLAEFQSRKYAARNTFIIDPDGVVRKIYRGVKPGGHSEEVLSELADLQKSTSVALPRP